MAQQIDGIKKLGLIVCLMIAGGAIFSSSSRVSASQNTSSAGKNPSPATREGGATAASAEAPKANPIEISKLEGRWEGVLQFDKNREDADPLNEVDTPAVIHLVYGGQETFTGHMMTLPKRPPMGAMKFAMTKSGDDFILKGENLGRTGWNPLLKLKPVSLDELAGTWSTRNYSDTVPMSGKIVLKRVKLEKPFPPKLSGSISGPGVFLSGQDVEKKNITLAIREEVSEDTYQGTLKGHQLVNGPFGGMYDPKAGVFEITTDRNTTLTLFLGDDGWSGEVDTGNGDAGVLKLK